MFANISYRHTYNTIGEETFLLVIIRTREEKEEMEDEKTTKTDAAAGIEDGEG